MNYGVALGPARICPSCRRLHPPGTTCAGGWGPWDGQPWEVPLRPVVTLSAEDIIEVEAHAEDVIATAKRLGLRNRWKYDSKAAELDGKKRGYGAEKAVSIYLGLPWRKIVFTRRDAPKLADVGDNVEVRIWGGRGVFCPVHDKDPDDRLIVFVYPARFPSYTLRGWLIARDGKRGAYRWTNPWGFTFWRVPGGLFRPFPIPEELVR